MEEKAVLPTLPVSNIQQATAADRFQYDMMQLWPLSEDTLPHHTQSK